VISVTIAGNLSSYMLHLSSGASSMGELTRSILLRVIFPTAIWAVTCVISLKAETKPEAMKHFRQGYEYVMIKEPLKALESYRKGAKIDVEGIYEPFQPSPKYKEMLDEAYALQNTDLKSRLPSLRS